jgi:hypothetical protein
MATATSKWSAQHEGHLPAEKPALTLDPAETLQRMRTLQTEQEIATKLLSDVEGRRDIVYEDMFDDNGNFTQEVGNILQRMMQITEIDRRPSNIKMNPEPLDTLVENMSEIRKAFTSTEYEWMLDL